MLIDYDKYSLIIDNKRTLIRSAAIHYFRMPGQEMWRDRLSKLKAAGYNAVDIYFCWGYHSSEPGKYYFTGIRDVRALLDITTELGLYVIARPGPYINAELSLGGLPTWLLNVPDIHLRNRKHGAYVYSEVFMHYLREWYSRIIPIINEYHNVIAFQIENEYYTDEAEPDYMQELYDMARSMGIKAPIFHNDVLGFGLYSDIVNIYAFDNYPTINVNFDWREFPESFGVLDNAEANLGEATPDAPLFVAELQAGWYDKWHGIGYDNIRRFFGREHINIVTKTVLSQGITMFNHYMGCGGTSWNQLSSSELYTSYDFAAPVSEVGIPKGNYCKAKEVNHFLQGFGLCSTDLVAEGDDVTDTSGGNIFARIRKDNVNGCNWLFIRNLNKDGREFAFTDNNKAYLQAFDMKILPLNLPLKGCNIDFSGMSLFGRVENNDSEIVLMLIEEGNYLKLSGFETITTAIPAQKEGDSTIIHADDIKDLDSCELCRSGKSTKIIFITQSTADKTWIIKDKIVIGPEFLTENCKQAAFSESRDVKVFTLEDEKTHPVTVVEQPEMPVLDKWQWFKASPEIDFAYDTSSWNYAEENKLDSISNKIYDDYIWYKGIFHGHIDEISINAKHCYAVYINAKQVIYHDCVVYCDGEEVPENITFRIDSRYLNQDGPNEITVLVQNLGFDRGFQNELQIPRGIIFFKTLPEKEIEWQLQGGLTPINENWTEISAENLDHASDNSYIKLFHSTFEYKKQDDVFNPLLLDLTDLPYERADVYLNGKMIGRHWKVKSPQTLFYLPEGFLENRNIICLVVWDIRPRNVLEKGYETTEKYVKIKIRNIKSFKLVPVSEIV